MTHRSNRTGNSSDAQRIKNILRGAVGKLP